MVQLTVGIVAGIIAALVVAIQHMVPGAIAWLAVASIEKDATAVTWTVTSRLVASSHWPTLLRSDAAASHKVHRGVLALTWISPFLLSSIAISAIIAPLGLTETTTQTTYIHQTAAQYAPDTSLVGDATPPRADNMYTRDCSYWWGNACPGSQTNTTPLIFNASLIANNVTFTDNHIASHLQDVYSSGLKTLAPTVASPFDIQARFHLNFSDPDHTNGEQQRVPRYRQIMNLINDDSIQLIEGLIIDAKHGGIGFRNHTIPQGMPYGAVWKEDILFVDSETSCVNLNLTVEFKVPRALEAGAISSYTYSDNRSISLVDRGGFSSLRSRPRYPQVDTSDPQANPNLWSRAFNTALLTNVYTAAVWNVTNLSVWSIPNDNTSQLLKPAFDFVNSEYGRALVLEGADMTIEYETLEPKKLYSFLVPYDFDSNSRKDKSTNPWNVTSRHFYDITNVCHGGSPLANASSLAVTCGILIAPARLSTDEPLPLVYDPGISLVSPLYSCASVPRASIKEVAFRYAGSGGLTGLHVDSIKPKVYVDEVSKPLWAVENTGLDLLNANPLWGLTQYKNEANVSTFRSDRLYIPGSSFNIDNAFDGKGRRYNFPAIDFLTSAHERIYSTTYDSRSAAEQYTGKSSVALYRRWQELSANASTVGKVIDLVWTDIMGNALVGTKSWLDNPAAPGAVMSVQPMQHGVGYRWQFGVFALVTLGLCVCLIIAALAWALYVDCGLPAIRSFLKHTSVGRLYTYYAAPDNIDMESETKAWIKRIGYMRIVPIGTDGIEMTPWPQTDSHSEHDVLVDADTPQALERTVTPSEATLPSDETRPSLSTTQSHQSDDAAHPAVPASHASETAP